MKRRFFFKRAAIFFAIMLIPTLVVFGLFLGFTVRNARVSLTQKGEQTVSAALDNCDVMIRRTGQQNDLLTGTTRMNVSLKRALFEKDMTYFDSVFLTALGSMVSSSVDSNLPLDRIMIWLDGAHRLFSSEGSSIQPLSQLEDQAWLQAYSSMPEDKRRILMRSVGADGREKIVSIQRMLLQDGCTVVDIDAALWTEKLMSLLQREHEHLYLLNEDASVLLHVTNDKRSGVEFTDELPVELLCAQPGEWVRTEQGRFLVTRAELDDLMLLSFVPYDTLGEELKVLRLYFVGILAVNIFVVMFLAYMTTRRISSQMMLMIDMLDDALKGKPVKKPDVAMRDEYDVITNNILYMYLRDSALRTELQEKQYQHEHAEMMALQLQINPHFLYNTLQSLDVTIRGGKADRYDVCDIIRAISDILKYALSSPQEMVSLRDEIHYLKEYAAVQKFRFGGRFVLYYEVDEELLDAQVFRLMLQPLVENCMLHGLNGLSERGYIWVRVSCVRDWLRISVKDSGSGMQAEELEALRARIKDSRSRSIGLTNLNRRLLLRYGEASALKIISAPGEGTEVSFAIPYKQMEVSSKTSDDIK